MEMKKVVLFLYVAAVWASGTADAAPRSERQARTIAENFLKDKAGTMKRTTGRLTLVATSETLDTPEKRTTDTQSPAWYVYNQEEDAFVIVSGDDGMKDILGYSTEGSFSTENLPDNLRTWLGAYTALAQAAPTSSTVGLRDLTSAYPTAVSPLLGDINYDQDTPYNWSCPIQDGSRCVTGCTPTATASILSYWKYPACGDGFRTYTTESHNILCRFDFDGTPFDWKHILPSYETENYTYAQAKAIATLMYACGVASETDYGAEASGTYPKDNLNGLIENLGINPYTVILLREGFSSSEWMALIKKELAAGRPILYGGYDAYDGGHTFVLDGYDAEGMVHVNWGWGGLSNGYFEILSLDPSSMGIGGGTGGGYAFQQNMLYGLAPKDVLAVPQSYFYLKGGLSFENQTAYITDIYNYGHGFTGSIGVIAEQNGNQHLLGEEVLSETLGTLYGYSSLEIPLDHLDDLETGTYTVYAASRMDEETTWSKSRGPETGNPEYILTVGSGQTYTFRPARDTAFPVATLSTDSPLYPNAYADLDIRIRNERTDNETFGELYLILNGQGIDHGFIYREQVLLAAGEEQALTCNVQLPYVTGTYTLTPYWTSGNITEVIGPDLDLNILQGISTNGIALRNCALDRTSYESGSWITCSGELYIEDRDADFFSGELYFGVFPTEGGSTLTGRIIPFTISQDSPATFSERLKADLQPGEYQFVVMKTWGTQEDLWNTPFSVTEASGIGNQLADAPYGKPALLSTPDAAALCFRYAGNVKTARLYNLAGQSVGLSLSPEHDGDTYRIPVQGLPEGGYILKLITEDGRTETLKFIR